MPFFKIIKKLLKKHHQKKTDESDPTVTGKLEEEWSSARRNAIDFGPRPRCNGTPLCLFTRDEPVTLREIKRENERLQELDERVYWGDSEENVSKATRAYRYPAQLDSVLHDPFPQDRRTFGDVLAFMHGEGINVAGFPKTERERVDCENGRCRCLGPMIRDV